MLPFVERFILERFFYVIGSFKVQNLADGKLFMVSKDVCKLMHLFFYNFSATIEKLSCEDASDLQKCINSTKKITLFLTNTFY